MTIAEEMNQVPLVGDDERLRSSANDPFLSLPIKEREVAAALFLEGGDPSVLPLKREIVMRIQGALSYLGSDSEVVAIARCLDVLQRVQHLEEVCDER